MEKSPTLFNYLHDAHTCLLWTCPKGFDILYATGAKEYLSAV